MAPNAGSARQIPVQPASSDHTGERRTPLISEEPNYRCACIAQLVEQLTLKRRHLLDSNGHLRTDLRLTKSAGRASTHSTHMYIRVCPQLPKIALR
jgi:hypothetical protein